MQTPFQLETNCDVMFDVAQVTWAKEMTLKKFSLPQPFQIWIYTLGERSVFLFYWMFKPGRIRNPGNRKRDRKFIASFLANILQEAVV